MRREKWREGERGRGGENEREGGERRKERGRRRKGERD